MIAKVVLCLFLIRATITDISSRKIENHLILWMVISRVAITLGKYCCNHNILFAIDAISSHLIVIVVLLVLYSLGQNYFAAGDIKLLLVGQLFLTEKELISWFALMPILAILTSFIIGVHRRFPLAPFVLLSTFIITAMDCI